MSPFWLGDEPPEREITLQQFIDDLVAKSDIIRELDVGEPRFRKWLERGERIQIPKPLKVLGHVKVYSMAEWRSWYGRWLTKYPPEKGWRNTKHHGEGESFFTYWR